MNKKTKYALYAGTAGGVINGILNIIKQNNESPSLPLNYSQVLKAVAKGAAACGACGFIIGAYVDHQNSLEKPLNTDLKLGKLVKELQLRHQDKKYQMLCEKANWLISKIKKEFGDDLQGEPFRFGSTEEDTALKEKYDIDIAVSFKHNAFASIFDMYEILGDFLMNLEGKYDVLRVRKQTVSIGVFFDLGYGREGKLDIVPIKITNRKGNKTSGYLHKNSSDFFTSHSYQKTDPIILSKEKLSKTQKEILIALKKWKKNKNVPISSHLLQNFIQDAYYCNSNRIPHGLTKKIIMVLSHIRNHIDTIYLTSIENTNNVLTDIPENDKMVIKSACNKVIENYQYQPNSIIEYF